MLTFKGIQLHNVSELEQNSSTEGFYMLRVPKDVENGLNDMAKDRNILNTGVELRFVAVDDEVRITLQIDAENDILWKHSGRMAGKPKGCLQQAYRNCCKKT